MWTYWICDTQSGAKLAPVEPSAGQWSTGLTAGSGQHTFLLQADPFTRAERQDLFRPWARTLVQCWDGVPKYAGLLVKDTYNRDAAFLTVDHLELRQIFTRRFTWGPNGYVVGGDLVITTRAPEGALRAVVERGAIGGGSPGQPWYLPVVLPSNTSGSISATFKNWQFQTIENALTAIQSRADGCDLYFRPQFTGGVLEWVAVVGSPRLAGAALDLPLNVEKASPVGVQVTDDALGQLTGVFTIGAGSEEDMLTGFAGTFSGFTTPILDKSESFKSESDQGALDSYASAELEAHRDPTRQTSFSLLVSEFDFAGFTVGARPRLRWEDDLWVDDGWQDLYVIGMSGDLTDLIKLEVQAA